MRSNLFIRTLLAAVFVAACCVAASAQTTQVEGVVKLKQADGTETPVVGATIDIYRIDIKQEFHTKTDKKGHYIHAGLPFVGTYTLVVSAPGRHARGDRAAAGRKGGATCSFRRHRRHRRDDPRVAREAAARPARRRHRRARRRPGSPGPTRPRCRRRRGTH